MNWPKFRSRPGARPRSRRRDSFMVRAGRVLRGVALTALAGGLIAGGAFAYYAIHHFTYESDYFTIREIIITGASGDLETQARQRLDEHLDYVGHNLVEQDADVLGDLLGRLPRARQALVQKIYPNTLSIRFSERRPLMVVQLEDPWLVDRQGVLLGRVRVGELAGLGLPVLTGVQRRLLMREGHRIEQDNVAEVLAAVDFIIDHDRELCGQIVEWNVAAAEGVIAIMRGGTEVRFGTRPPLELLDKLSGGFHSERVRGEFEQATYIDLRMDDQLVIMPKSRNRG